MKINSNTIRNLIKLHIVAMLCFPFMWSVLGLPWNAIYVFDVLVCIEFAWAFRDIQTVMRRISFWHVIPYLLLLLLYFLLTQLFNFVSPILSVMAYRRIVRFFLFYFACAVILTVQDVNKIMDILIGLQPVNLILTLFQYFVQNLEQDCLGGLFGVEKGANAYSNIFLCVVSAYTIIKYLSKKEKIMTMLLSLCCSLVIAALAELKIFFIEIVVIMLLAVLFSNPSVRTIKTLIFGVSGFSLAVMLFGRLFPEHLEVLMNLAIFISYTSESIYGYEISRLGAFQEINRLFFKGDILSNLFGFGFGNCETGSAFYEQYGKYSYTWFAHQVSFLETGYVGVVLYVAFYVLVYLNMSKNKKNNPDCAYYYSFAQIICVLCAIWFVYNQALRMELAYLIFFVLSIPAIVQNNRVKRINRER